MQSVIGLLCLCVGFLRADSAEPPAHHSESRHIAVSNVGASDARVVTSVRQQLVDVYLKSDRVNVLTKKELKTAKDFLPFLFHNQLFKGYVQEDLADAVAFVLREIGVKNGALPLKALSAAVMDMLHLLIPQYPMNVVSLRVRGENVSVVLEWPEEPSKRMVAQVVLPEEYTDLIRAMRLYSSHFGEAYFKLLGLILYLAEHENRSVTVSGDIFDGWDREEVRQPMALKHLFGAHKERSRMDSNTPHRRSRGTRLSR